MVPFSLYVHWPYCTFLCRFCAFSKARVPAKGVEHERITSALLKELRTSLAPHKDKVLQSIYFGGGTPSLAQPRNIAQIIEAANSLVPLASDAEITLESNPTSAEVGKMRDFKQAGVTRYSIGIQTLDDRTLARMGRLHTGAEGLAAVDRARALFPGKVSFDMIFGFEGQTLDQWQKELETVLKHADNHISVYQLTVEPGTPLFRDRNAQRVVLPSGDLSAQMYESAVEMCTAKGFRHYEVANYAVPGSESMHNMGYWQGRQWVGIGPSAHSRFIDPSSNQRISSVRLPDIQRWAQHCEKFGHGTAKSTVISDEDAKQEAVVFGLRMLDGITDRRFAGISGGQSLKDYLHMDRVQQYVDDGYLLWNSADAKLAPTERGLEVIDSILIDIVP
ncbi:radical S-adenosyl methionine domain-containing protein 1 [Coemansia sp. RSA 564]|nr:radical S-adenosyl methionine domain-containing protein 1 [Coemansia sp. RSA 564]KAJ2180517.1 radical S-adenosyl methionine domain-containing protein 1 [Coemansia sp. RSA 532]